MSEATRTALITGSSRGIGAATAALLAARGFTVVVNYRNKAKRAEQVVETLREAGGDGLPIQADITNHASVQAMIDTISSTLGHLDLLILNASGGMEKNMPEDYALRLNRDAQVELVEAAMPLMREGSRIVYVTSHQAHFVDTSETLAEYLPVAQSKRAGEDALRKLIPTLTSAGIEFVTVSADMILGTVTATLLNRMNPGAIEQRKEEAGKLYTVEEFASEIDAAAFAPIPEDHTILVGDTSSFVQ